MQSKRIFITGATGLVGSHIARLLLARGYDNITALRRPGSPDDLVKDVEERITWIDGDITDYDDVEKGASDADWIVHSAALISYQKRYYRKMHEVNVSGTSHIVNAALHCNVEKLLHISSMAVFTRTGGEQHVDENTPWEPTPYTSEYGLTKHKAEMEVWRGQAEGLHVNMLLPTIVMGSGYWKSGSSSMFYKAANGLSFYPVGSIGFVDVRDLALLSVLSLENEDAPTRMIANGSNHSLGHVLGRICELAGKKPPKVALPPSLAEVAWRLMAPVEWITGKEPALTKSSARTTACKQSFDNSRSLTVEGFQYTPLEQSLQDVMDNYAVAAQDGFKAIPMDFLPHHLE